jgi:hypothetical protein
MQKNVRYLSTNRQQKPKGLIGKFIDNIREGFERDKDMQVWLFNISFSLISVSKIPLFLRYTPLSPTYPSFFHLILTPINFSRKILKSSSKRQKSLKNRLRLRQPRNSSEFLVLLRYNYNNS